MTWRQFSTWVAIGCLLLAEASDAASPSKMPQDQVCVADRGERVVDARRATRWLMSEFPVTLNCLDYDDDGDPIHIDRVLVLVDDNYPEFTSAGRCTGLDQTNILASQQFLMSFFLGIQPDTPPESRITNYQSVSPLNLGAQSKRIRLGDVYGGPMPQTEAIELEDEMVEVYKFLSYEQDSIRVICAETNEQPAQTKVEEDVFLPGSFIVRGNIKDLKKPLTEKTTKSISPAVFSLVENRISNSTEFNISGVAGYRLDALAIRNTALAADIIPYIGLDRRFATGGDTNEVDNIKVGINAAGFMRLGTGSAHGFDLHPQLTIDSDADTKIGSLSLLWEPSFRFLGTTIPNIGISTDYGTLVPTFSGGLIAGNVFEDGGNAALRDDETFLRLSSDIGLRYIPRTGTFVDQFIPFLTYKYVFGAAGELSNADRIEFGFNFVIPKTQNFSVGLKYSNGQADETFQDIEFIEATFGVKF